jgi:hypothetical protein
LQLPDLRVRVTLHFVQAPVNWVHAEQFTEQAEQMLLPGLYFPAGQVIGFAQTPLEKAVVELQPHIPGFGVFVVKVDLHPVQYPVLLQAVQFAGQAPQTLFPRLYWPVGQAVKVEIHSPLTCA